MCQKRWQLQQQRERLSASIHVWRGFLSIHSALRGLFPGYPVFHLLGKNQNIICLILLSLQLALRTHAFSKITLTLKESDLFIMHLIRKQPSLWNYLVSIQVSPFCLSSPFSRIIHTDRRRQQGLLWIRAMAASYCFQFVIFPHLFSLW